MQSADLNSFCSNVYVSSPSVHLSCPPAVMCRLCRPSWRKTVLYRSLSSLRCQSAIDKSLHGQLLSAADIIVTAVTAAARAASPLLLLLLGAVSRRPSQQQQQGGRTWLQPWRQDGQKRMGEDWSATRRDEVLARLPCWRKRGPVKQTIVRTWPHLMIQLRRDSRATSSLCSIVCHSDIVPSDLMSAALDCVIGREQIGKNGNQERFKSACVLNGPLWCRVEQVHTNRLQTFHGLCGGLFSTVYFDQWWRQTWYITHATSLLLDVS